MCTVIVLNEFHPDYPLIVAANRDEHYYRPSEAPDIVQVLPLAAVAPTDKVKGGTWFGAAQGGWVVCVTNQDDGQTIPNKKSRGTVVKDCLLLGDHRATAKYLVGLNVNDFNPFNLVFGRPGAMFLCKMHHDKSIELDIIPQGITVITSDTNDLSTYAHRVEVATRAAELIRDQDDENAIVTKLEEALRDHTSSTGLNDSMCVHDDQNKFGTVSSSLVTVSKNGDVTYHYSEGAPCCSAGLSPVHHLLGLDVAELDTQ